MMLSGRFLSLLLAACYVLLAAEGCGYSKTTSEKEAKEKSTKEAREKIAQGLFKDDLNRLGLGGGPPVVMKDRDGNVIKGKDGKPKEVQPLAFKRSKAIV